MLTVMMSSGDAEAVAGSTYAPNGCDARSFADLEHAVDVPLEYIDPDVSVRADDKRRVDPQNIARSDTTKFLPGPLMPLANTL